MKNLENISYPARWCPWPLLSPGSGAGLPDVLLRAPWRYRDRQQL